VLGDYITGAWVTGIVIMLAGFVSALYIKETWGTDLSFTEL
jgi:hypothetical protein